MREKVELSLYEHLTELDERNDFHLIANCNSKLQ